MGTLPEGNSAKNLDMLFGCQARRLSVRTLQSQAKTASLACLVTTWGARSRARLNTSLNCALAACSCQGCEDSSCLWGSRLFRALECHGMLLTSQTRLIIMPPFAGQQTWRFAAFKLREVLLGVEINM